MEEMRVDGNPTKEFFVQMLTRDILLNDAIMDLLDNCLDGVLRLNPAKDAPDHYKGYSARITITKDEFTIEDNCGGIPRAIAIKQAFRMGRPSDSEAEDMPTVGIYGIGMKRAIFKIGEEAVVTTNYNGDAYKVTVPKDWVNSKDRDWGFPLENISDLPDYIKQGGTHIKITHFHERIAEQWNRDDEIKSFADNLAREIQACYSLIIEKGFCIDVNGTPVKAIPIQLIASKEKGAGIKPYIFLSTVDGVKISVIVGFYSPIASDDDIDAIQDAKRMSSEAGWTVVCNDRVILYNDKTFITGWGETGIPNYHTQFIGIKGLATFQSNDSSKLPMTTTKRNIDLSSPIYHYAKEHMKEGLRLFTSYTSNWKGRLEEEKVYSSQTNYVRAIDFINNTSVQESYHVIPMQKRDNQVFKPILPKPERERDYITVRYTKPIDDVSLLANKLFGEDLDSATPGIVGAKCFDIVFEQEVKNTTSC